MTKKQKKNLDDYVKSVELAFDLFDGDIKKTAKWSVRSAPEFFDLCPLEACLMGQGEFLIAWLKDRGAKTRRKK